jgi:hypothetical protein
MHPLPLVMMIKRRSTYDLGKKTKFPMRGLVSGRHNRMVFAVSGMLIYIHILVDIIIIITIMDKATLGVSLSLEGHVGPSISTVGALCCVILLRCTFKFS